MKNKNLVVKTFTLITTILAFIFLNRLRTNSQEPKVIGTNKMFGNPSQIPSPQKILLESVTDDLFPKAPTPLKNDLTLIHGIGAKSEIALNQAGIFTYEHLALQSEEQLQKILRDADLRIVNCVGWVEQSRTML